MIVLVVIHIEPHGEKQGLHACDEKKNGHDRAGRFNRSNENPIEK
jgi:hypothetical protein